MMVTAAPMSPIAQRLLAIEPSIQAIVDRRFEENPQISKGRRKVLRKRFTSQCFKDLRQAISQALRAAALDQAQPEEALQHFLQGSYLRMRELPGLCPRGEVVWDALVRALFKPEGLHEHKKALLQAFAAARAQDASHLESALQSARQGIEEARQRKALSEARQQEELRRKQERLEQARLEAKRQRLEAQARAERLRTEFLQRLPELFADQGRMAAFGIADFDRLATEFRQRCDNKTLTLAGAVRDFGLPVTVRERLEAQKQVRALVQADACAEAARLRDWRKSLVHSSEVPARLGITKAEYDRWLANGRLTPVEYREFRKWGKDLKAPIFDPEDLDAITPEVVARYRAQDAEASRLNRANGARQAQVKTRVTRSIKKALRMDNYAAHFLVARGLARHWHLCLGPTNSGKTHEAMQALMAADSGVYLAPLRLLALENYDRLRAAGIPANLLTGEERIIDPAARHTCATVEMCNFSDPVAVAVVDEVQMLQDPQRGWAWTAALLGVPAQQVYACGALHAAPALRTLAALVNEPVQAKVFERLVPLDVAGKAASLEDIRPGDALIAFSRQEVLRLASLLRERGHAVSVIYGALSPEVRRSQARAYAHGQTQVVVATDAIGMGLNLPIRRVVLSTVSKWDGQAHRTLSLNEVQQIAGRAGRFGLSDAGEVTSLERSDLSFISRALAKSQIPFAAPFAVMPTWPHVATVLEALGTQDVGVALEFFSRIKFGGAFVQADFSDVWARYELLADAGLEDLSPRDAFTLVCAPADPGRGEDALLLQRTLDALVSRQPMPIPRRGVNLATREPSAADLEQAEGYARLLALFSWVACKWPHAVQDRGLAELRQEVTEFIDAALLSVRIHGKRPRDKRPRWRDSDFEDEGNDFDG